MTQPYRGAFLYVLDAQQERGEAEVDQQGEGIHDGGDEGRGHHRRSKPIFLASSGSIQPTILAANTVHTSVRR